ncbi:hypothetical protein H5410_022863 [Solanum commersonii]|uniref:Uncharacterized protein n=1 Tax=Solanum commersonii TaxID=4109 RepID=A0A9J5ZJS5_SOLCO|nr:hypothetical protein H5410_022863 [Solanum commersonii]
MAISSEISSPRTKASSLRMTQYGFVLRWHDSVADEAKPEPGSNVQVPLLNRSPRIYLPWGGWSTQHTFNIFVVALNHLASDHNRLHRSKLTCHLLVLGHQLTISCVKFPNPGRNFVPLHLLTLAQRWRNDKEWVELQPHPIRKELQLMKLWWVWVEVKLGAYSIGESRVDHLHAQTTQLGSQ